MQKVTKNLSTTKLKILKDELKVRWTYSSNALEGNTISLGDTAFIIEYGLTIKGKSIVEHNEVIGHSKAVDIIYELIKKEHFTQEDLFLLHKAVQTNIVVDIESPIGAYKVVENGRYVLENENRIYLAYPHPNDIEYLMKLWFKEFGILKNEDLPLEEAIKKYTSAHIAFTSIHPFFDANGRLARLISNLFMLKNGYLPIIVGNENRYEYIKLLSSYNLHAPKLDKTIKTLIEENQYYNKLYEFFTNEYSNSLKILEELQEKEVTPL